MSATLEDKINTLNNHFMDMHTRLLTMQSHLLNLTDNVNELQRAMADLVPKKKAAAKKVVKHD